jgi:hypothetical protein
MSESVPASVVFYHSKPETNSNSFDETIIKKPTPIELELKYIEKTRISQTRKEHCKSLIFLPHLSNLPYEYFKNCGDPYVHKTE